ncbi:Arm DNA-binding domain-containing protein [Povalibacter uvarum]|uniref:Arm DNA-binding domain-containing protein n=1 Tax=Povalibacter uvarum TaxID=732238 RepID=UPI00160B6A70
MTRLSDTKIRAARPRVRPYKLFDTDGLFLLITPTGRRWWRQRYRFAGKERLRGLGTYPEISLAEAREESLAIRKLLAKGLVRPARGSAPWSAT